MTRGIDKVKIECRRTCVDEPEIKYDFDGVMTTFTGRSNSKNANVGLLSRKTPVETPVETLVETNKMILIILKENPMLTLSQVATTIGKSLRAVERASSKLVQEGKLQHQGPKKGGRWLVLEK